MTLWVEYGDPDVGGDGPWDFWLSPVYGCACSAEAHCVVLRLLTENTREMVDIRTADCGVIAVCPETVRWVMTVA